MAVSSTPTPSAFCHRPAAKAVLDGGGFEPEPLAVFPPEQIAVLRLEQVAVFTGIRREERGGGVSSHGVAAGYEMTSKPKRSNSLGRRAVTLKVLSKKKQ